MSRAATTTGTLSLIAVTAAGAEGERMKVKARKAARLPDTSARSSRSPARFPISLFLPHDSRTTDRDGAERLGAAGAASPAHQRAEQPERESVFGSDQRVVAGRGAEAVGAVALDDDRVGGVEALRGEAGENLGPDGVLGSGESIRQDCLPRALSGEVRDDLMRSPRVRHLDDPEHENQQDGH